MWTNVQEVTIKHKLRVLTSLNMLENIIPEVHACDTDKKIKFDKKNLHKPENPSWHRHSNSSNDFSTHSPLCWQGDELHAVFSLISQRLAENPIGHLHSKVDWPSRMTTWHVPPFWQRGAVKHGFVYSQNSPTYRNVQLWIAKKILANCN